MKKINLTVLAIGATAAIAVTGIGAAGAATNHSNHFTVAAKASGHVTKAHIKGVNPGAAAANRAGYKQATRLVLHKAATAKLSASELAALGGGGCTVGYGLGKCLPLTPPAAAQMDMTVAAMPWTCAQVHAFFPAGIVVDKKVKVVDPAHLDGNHDGVACGKGDS